PSVFFMCTPEIATYSDGNAANFSTTNGHEFTRIRGGIDAFRGNAKLPQIVERSKKWKSGFNLKGRKSNDKRFTFVLFAFFEVNSSFHFLRNQFARTCVNLRFCYFGFGQRPL